MRICIIGNSHIGVLKKAWMDGLDVLHPEIEISFFGAQRDLLKTIRARDGTLGSDDKLTRRSLAMTTGLDDPEIRPSDFNHVVLHGLVDPNWIAPLALNLARYLHRGGSTVSSGLLRSIAMERYEKSIQFHMANLVRGLSKVPMTVSPKPYLSRDVLDHETQGRPYKGIEELPKGSGVGFFRAHHEVLVEVAAANRQALLPQPPETIVGECFTDPGFCRGSIKLTSNLDEEHPADDFGHMNVRYGALVLRRFLDTIGIDRLDPTQAPCSPA